MLSHIIEMTENYISSKPKSIRKKFGQFFTSITTARFMASLLKVPFQNTIKILDPGAGSGILSAALIENIEKQIDTTTKIELTCYETDSDVATLLETNLNYIQKISKINFSYKIISENYILTQSDEFSGKLLASISPPKYDLIISNPPYFKLSKDAPEAISMQTVCYGAPNIYFLFLAMSLFNLRNNGELVYIIPRSWTSGAYFASFRKYLLKYGKITDIHIFSSRNNVFDKEEVLQETMILKLKKSKYEPKTITITSSLDSNDFDKISPLFVPYNIIVQGKEKFVFLISNQNEINVLNTVNSIGKPLVSNGLKMKTGLTVDYRYITLLRNTSGKNVIPLFYPHHIKEGKIIFPIGKSNEYISDELPSLVQINKNYLFIKRFTAKEEKRRLQCAIYLANVFCQYKYISTQNKINFIDTIDNSEMSEETVYGLYVVLNSSLYDSYYRILNGSTQVNSTEINTIPMPSKADLTILGQRIMNSKDFSTTSCDNILKAVINVND